MSQIVRTSYGGHVVVFRHPHSPILHCRLKKPDGTGWKSKTTGKDDPNEALEIAEHIYAEMKLRQKVGLSSDPTTFRQIAELHIKRMREKAASGEINERKLRDYIPVIERYFIPYFGDKPVEAITNKDIADYKAWRKVYWTSGPGSIDPWIEYERHGRKLRRPARQKLPSKSKLDKEDVCLRQIFETGIENDLVKEFQVPTVRSERLPHRARHRRDMKAAFEPEEYRRFTTFLEEWIKVGRNRERRELLRDAVILLCDTGIRPGTESDGLRWKHVRNRLTKAGNPRKEVVVSGKTGTRPVVVGIDGGKALGRIWHRRELHLRQKLNVRGWPGPKMDKGEAVIALPDGTPVKNDYLRGLFDKALKAAGMLHDRNGKKRSIYDCRHTFARNQLNHGVSVYWLKDQMGTSVAMLEKYYGDTTAFQGADGMVSLRHV